MVFCNTAESLLRWAGFQLLYMGMQCVYNGWPLAKYQANQLSDHPITHSLTQWPPKHSTVEYCSIYSAYSYLPICYMYVQADSGH